MLGIQLIVVRRCTGLRYVSVITASARSYSKKSTPDDDCGRKPKQCVSSPPALQPPKCPPRLDELCQQGTLKIAPLPPECKSDKKCAPVYDKACKRPHINPCLKDMSATCKATMIARPCAPPCVRKQRHICLTEPDCAYERRIDWGLRIRQLLLGLGALVGGLILYRMYGSEVKIIEHIVHDKKERRFKRPMEIVKDPDSSSDIPDEIDFLVIGGGTAAFSAQKAIRTAIRDAKVLIISNSPPYLPSMRPPLSHWLWIEADRERALDLDFVGWDGQTHNLFFEQDQYYLPVPNLRESEKGGVAVARGWAVQKLNPSGRTAILDDGKKIKYKQCLLATGGRPKVLAPFDGAEPAIQNKVTYYRNSFDFQELEEIIQHGVKCIAVVGGGLLGTELSAALKERTKNEGTRVVNIVKDAGNLKKLLPTYLSKRISEILSERGIHVLTESVVEDVTKEGSSIRLYVTNDKCVTADHVVVAMGIEPNIDLAANSCLEVDRQHGGFLVNSEMQSCSGLYAAGDCASFYDCSLGRRREEHHNYALATGQIAGENMSGKASQLKVQPSFWCHLSPEYEIEGTGIVDSSIPTVGVFPKKKLHSTDDGSENGNGDNNGNGHDEDDEENGENGENGDNEFDRVEEETDVETTLETQSFEKGVIYYLNEAQEIVGILTLNLPGKISLAQKLVKEKKKYDDINELTKSFELHDDPNAKKKRRRRRR